MEVIQSIFFLLVGLLLFIMAEEYKNDSLNRAFSNTFLIVMEIIAISIIFFEFVTLFNFLILLGVK